MAILKVGWPGEVDAVEKDVLPFKYSGRSAGGRDGTRDGERMIVGRMFGSDVGGRGGLAGGLCDLSGSPKPRFSFDTRAVLL